MEKIKVYKRDGAVIIEKPGIDLVYLNIDDTRLYISGETLMINDGQVNRAYELGTYEFITNEAGTLEFSTKADAMDYLMLLMDSSTSTVVERLMESLENNATAQKQLLQLLRPLSNISSGTNRLLVEVSQPSAAAMAVTASIASAQTLATVTNVGTVGSLTNQVNIGGVNALDLQFNMAHAAWNGGIRSNVTF